MPASRRWSSSILAVACGVAFALVGCSSFGGPGDPPIDTVWRVVELDGQPVPRLPDNRAPTLLLDGASARASGFTGCNRMTGGYVLAGDQLSFGVLATTRMACEAPASEIEMAYEKALAVVARWRRREARLELLDAQRAVLMRLEVAGRVDELPQP